MKKGLKSCCPAKKPKLSAKNFKDRIAFCQTYRHWTETAWEVTFTDESTFTQFACYAPKIRHPKLSRYEYKYVLPTVKMPKMLKVWGAISAFGRAGLWDMPDGTTINGSMYVDIWTFFK